MGCRRSWARSHGNLLGASGDVGVIGVATGTGRRCRLRPLDASTGAAGTAPPARLRYAQGRAGALTGACLAALFERRVAFPSGCGGSSLPCMARSGHAIGHGRQLALRVVPVPCPPPGVRDGSGMAGLVFIPLWRWVGRCGSRAGRPQPRSPSRHDVMRLVTRRSGSVHEPSPTVDGRPSTRNPKSVACGPHGRPGDSPFRQVGRS